MWFGLNRPVIPDHLEGCRTALFTTRQIARINLPSVKSSYPKAKVVKVDVRIMAAGKE
jgi:hypothetical protein